VGRALSDARAEPRHWLDGLIPMLDVTPPAAAAGMAVVVAEH
jgi:hypothetical protein